MKTVGELHEERLIARVSEGRRIVLTLLLFALALIAAGALRWAQQQAVDRELKAVEATLPKTWGPLETFYDEAGYRLQAYAEAESAPWSQMYVLATTYLTFSGGDHPSPQLQAWIDRLGATARRIHRYNADIQMIASAQRRQLSFRQLTKRELRAIDRVVHQDFKPDEEKPLEEETRKLAALILKLSAAAQKALPSGAEPNPIQRVLMLRNPKGRSLLEAFAAGKAWNSAETGLTVSNIYYDGGLQGDGGPKAEPPETLRKRIEALPGDTIAEVESREAALKARQKDLREGATVNLPVVGIAVPAGYVTLSAIVLNVGLVAALLGVVLSAIRSAKLLALHQPAGVIVLLVEELTTPARLRRGLSAAALMSPAVAATLLFGLDQKAPWAAPLAAAVLATLQFVTLRAMQQLWHTARKPWPGADARP